MTKEELENLRPGDKLVSKYCEGNKMTVMNKEQWYILATMERAEWDGELDHPDKHPDSICFRFDTPPTKMGLRFKMFPIENLDEVELISKHEFDGVSRDR